MTKRKDFVTTLQEALEYDSETGLFHWSPRSKPYKKYGHRPAGSIAKNGYVYIAFNRKKYLAHRLAFLFVTGEIPPPGVDVDHINGDRKDNRLSNLRLCSRADNLANSNLSAAGLPRGVQKNGSGYMARIKRLNKVVYLGTFRTPGEAGKAYQKARQDFLGDFVIKGKRNEISAQ